MSPLLGYQVNIELKHGDETRWATAGPFPTRDAADAMAAKERRKIGVVRVWLSRKWMIADAIKQAESLGIVEADDHA